MKQRIAVISAVSATLISAIAAPPAGASALPTFSPGSGSYVLDTSALTLTGPSGTVHGINQNGVALFRFESVRIGSAATVTAVGSRPAELLAVHSFVLAGVIDASGASAVNFTAGPYAGGPGGGAGGKDGSEPGQGPGGGGQPGTADTLHDGGAGGGFGGAGARGASNTDPPAAGGITYGSLIAKLQGGSGGSGAGSANTSQAEGGGGGGGAIMLAAATLTVSSTGVLRANGGNGAVGADSASGGGSGGGIILRATTITVNGTVQAVGGNGGAGGCCSDGGAGGGGRILFEPRGRIDISGTMSVDGGTSGVASSGSVFNSGPQKSPDPVGKSGRINIAAIDPSALSIGKSLNLKKGQSLTVTTKLTDRATGAKLNGYTVTLFRRFSSTSAWTKVGSRTTGSNGTKGGANITLTPTRSVQYQWRFGGTTFHDPTTSPIQRVTVS